MGQNQNLSFAAKKTQQVIEETINSHAIHRKTRPK